MSIHVKFIKTAETKQEGRRLSWAWNAALQSIQNHVSLMHSWGNLSHSVIRTKKSEICQTNPFRLAESLKFTPEHCSLICNTLNKDYDKPHAGFVLRHVYALSLLFKSIQSTIFCWYSTFRSVPSILCRPIKTIIIIIKRQSQVKSRDPADTDAITNCVTDVYENPAQKIIPILCLSVR